MTDLEKVATEVDHYANGGDVDTAEDTMYERCEHVPVRVLHDWALRIRDAEEAVTGLRADVARYQDLWNREKSNANKLAATLATQTARLCKVQNELPGVVDVVVPQGTIPHVFATHNAAVKKRAQMGPSFGIVTVPVRGAPEPQERATTNPLSGMYIICRKCGSPPLVCDQLCCSDPSCANAEKWVDSRTWGHMNSQGICARLEAGVRGNACAPELQAITKTRWPVEDCPECGSPQINIDHFGPEEDRDIICTCRDCGHTSEISAWQRAAHSATEPQADPDCETCGECDGCVHVPARHLPDCTRETAAEVLDQE
jgi:hypothetical protein